MAKSENSSLFKVVLASSVGTLIEWYDFYIFGSLAAIISVHFFPAGNPTAALLSTLAAFAAGFVVRPFGSLVFGRLGDMVGRKYTFLLTLGIMGFSTFLIGIIPGYATIGFLAPLIVVLLRLLQGLALGGEYGGATTYVGEHAPAGQRGFYTSWIQTTATVGLLVSILVILFCRNLVGEEAFREWGWRLPFLFSVVLFAISVYIRLSMKESPMFSKLKATNQVSQNPLKESFVHRKNLKYVLLALLGATMGQGVVWYTGQFYALGFIQKAGLELSQAYNVILVALCLATPGFVLFGWLSDRIKGGRKLIMLLGLVFAVLTYRPIYQAMYETIDISYKQKSSAAPSETTSQKSMSGKSYLVVVSNQEFTDGSVQKVTTTTEVNSIGDAVAQPKTEAKITLGSSGYWALVWLVFIQVVYVTMVYGPIAAFLIELFPTKIRYTSLSLPYHIGNGVFGGLVPLVSTALVISATERGLDNAYLEGLWYPIAIASICAVISFFYINHRSYSRADD